MAHPSTAESYKFGARIIVDGVNHNLEGGSKIPTAPAEKWYYLAITLEMTENELIIKYYNSADGTTYSETVNSFTGAQKPADLLAKANLIIGKHGTGTIASYDRGMGFDINEFRIYNKVMSMVEIRNLSYVTPGQETTEIAPELPPPVVPEYPDPLQPNGLYDDKLIAYYDFEGNCEEVWGYDKAPAGTTKDNLTLSEVKVNKGIAYIPSTSGSYMAITDKIGDTADLVGKTIYIVFTATGVASPSNDLISSPNTFRYWLAGGSGDDNFKFGGGITRTPTVTGYKLTHNSLAPLAAEGLWYYTAITFDMTNDELIITAYNSADGSDYVASVSTFAGAYKPENLLRTSSLIFGKSGTGTEDRGVSFYIDEIRIYDSVFAADEVENLVYITPGQKTTLPEKPVDPEQPDDTNNPGDTEEPDDTNEPVDTNKPVDTNEPVDTEEPDDTNEPVDTNKPADTTEPVTTEPAPVDTSTPDTSDESDTLEDSANNLLAGCNASVSASTALIALLAVAGCAGAFRKKED